MSPEFITNKKDEVISQLTKEIEELQSRLKTEEAIRLKIGREADKEHSEFLFYKEDQEKREEYYKSQIGHLKRVIASEKRKRINSACANRRRNVGRKKLN